IANNANYYYERYYNGGNNRSFIQNASANLAWPSKNSRTVKILKGIIPVTLLAEQRPVVVSDAILSAKGKKLKAANSTFNVDDITNNNKQHQIKITYSDDGGDNPYDPYGRIQSIQQRLESQDAKGNKIPSNIQIFSRGQSNVQLQIMTQSVGTNSKIVPPATLVF